MDSPNMAVIGISIGIAALALLAIILWHNFVKSKQEKSGSSWTHITFRVLFDTILAVSLVTLGFETNMVRNLLRYELKNLLAYETNLRDPDYLNKRFAEGNIRAFRKAANYALLKRSTLEGEDKLLEEFIYPVLEGAICKSMRIVRDQRIKKTEEGVPYFLIIEDVELKISSSNEVRKVPISLQKTLKSIEGFSNNDLFRMIHIKINDVALEPLPRVSILEKEPFIVFQTDDYLTLEKNITIRWKIQFRTPLSFHWIGILKFPTKNVTISLHYDENELIPDMIIFGMGGEDSNFIIPQETATGNIRWEYENWIFKNHGWVVTWDLKSEPSHIFKPDIY